MANEKDWSYAVIRVLYNSKPIGFLGKLELDYNAKLADVGITKDPSKARQFEMRKNASVVKNHKELGRVQKILKKVGLTSVPILIKEYS